MANTLNLTARIELLKAMHNFVITEFSDEDNIFCWLANGVPDCPQEDDFEFIAEDDEFFDEHVEWFLYLAGREDMKMIDIYLAVFKRFF
jgi:hypothetical protein